MTVGIGGGGSVGLAFESVLGTYVAPTVFAPVLSEGLKYTEGKYYSPQIRQQTIFSDVKSGYYHVEGPVELELDPQNLPYWMYASRHTITKTGVGPFVYKFVPSSAGTATTAASGAVPRTLSITVVRNEVVFGYTGCIVGSYEFMIEDGVLKGTLNIVGLAEATQANPAESWAAPILYGAEAHSVYLAAAAVTPAFAAADTRFNGFNFSSNFNAEARNNIVANRSATYIRYGITEAEITSELDFDDKTDYEKMKNNDTTAIKLESLNGGATLAAATNGVVLQGNRVSYDTYDVGLEGMGDLVVAGFSGRPIGIAGGDAYQIEVKSAVDIT